jgi:hypothetical protein
MPHQHIAAKHITSESNKSYQPLSTFFAARLKMTRIGSRNEERVFSIELGSKRDVKNVSLDEDEKIIIEGSLGSLQRVQFLEDLVLEVTGSNGVLRLDLSTGDLRRAFPPGANDEGGRAK